LAGIAAGGLLAAMLFGDGFDGLQVLDLLLFAALAVGAVMLFRRMRRGAPQLAGAGALGGGYGQPVPKDLPLVDSQSAAPAVGFDAPAWFDESGFVGGAKRHFVALQAAWDQGDLGSLREYATPELLDELTRERTRLGAERHETEVVTLEAALAGIRRDGDQVVASILFSGLIREGHDARPEPFREIWHVAHAWESAAGDWLLTGIQQVSD
jgi:predicted lipid-binding transport protein (Tim44 family)